MFNDLFSSRDGYEISFQFSRLLLEELENPETALGKYVKQGKYYPHFLNKPAQRPIRQLYYALRLQDAVEKILSSTNKSLVLDVACGVGSASILFGLLGADVIGIDLKAPRLEVAQKRIEYYKQKTGKNLSVTFLNQNVFNYCPSEEIDMIHCQESISHIHPAEDFVLYSYNKIKNGGCLIISDANSLNPVPLFRAIKERGFNPYSVAKDPETDEEIGYAVERYFTVWGIKRLLRKANFKMQNIRMSCFIPHNLSTIGNFNFWKNMEIQLSKIPILSSFGFSI